MQVHIPRIEIVRQPDLPTHASHNPQMVQPGNLDPLRLHGGPSSSTTSWCRPGRLGCKRPNEKSSNPPGGRAQCRLYAMKSVFSHLPLWQAFTWRAGHALAARPRTRASIAWRVSPGADLPGSGTRVALLDRRGESFDASHLATYDTQA